MNHDDPNEKQGSTHPRRYVPIKRKKERGQAQPKTQRQQPLAGLQEQKTAAQSRFGASSSCFFRDHTWQQFKAFERRRACFATEYAFCARFRQSATAARV